MVEDRHVLSDAADVQQLVPQGVHEIHITPETPVLCIHRGRRVPFGTDGSSFEYHPQAARFRDGTREPYFVGDYKDTYDGLHYLIAPGYFRAPYGAALHFQKRAVVPGSRNPEIGFQASFIAIIGVVEGRPGGGFEVLKAVDDPESWAAFTPEECAEYEIAGEALDRPALINAIEPKVDIVSVNERITGQPESRVKAPTNRVKSGGKPSGVRTGPRRGGSAIEVTGPGADQVLQAIPADQNAVVRQTQIDRARQAAGQEPD